MRDGSRILFTTNASGALDDLKIGTAADVLPLDTKNSGLDVWDRELAGTAVSQHNSTGVGAWYDSNPTLEFIFGKQFGRGPLLAGAAAGFVPSAELGGDSTSALPDSGPTNGLLAEPRIDGFTDGVNVIQGVRSFDPGTGVWTSPDADGGSFLDPSSQMSYEYDANNPQMYGDTSGFNPVPADPTSPGGSCPPGEIEMPGVGCTPYRGSLGSISVTAINSGFLAGAGGGIPGLVCLHGHCISEGDLISEQVLLKFFTGKYAVSTLGPFIILQMPPNDLTFTQNAACSLALGTSATLTVAGVVGMLGAPALFSQGMGSQGVADVGQQLIEVAPHVGYSSLSIFGIGATMGGTGLLLGSATSSQCGYTVLP